MYGVIYVLMYKHTQIRRYAHTPTSMHAYVDMCSHGQTDTDSSNTHLHMQIRTDTDTHGDTHVYIDTDTRHRRSSRPTQEHPYFSHLLSLERPQAILRSAAHRGVIGNRRRWGGQAL